LNFSLLQEFFADYVPIQPSLFSLGHQPTSNQPLYGASYNNWDYQALERSVQGIASVLLSLKKKPVIRYEHMSPMAKKLGGDLQVRHTTHVMYSVLNCVSIGSTTSQLFLIFGRRKSRLFFYFWIGAMIPLPRFFLSGHTRLWYTKC